MRTPVTAPIPLLLVALLAIGCATGSPGPTRTTPPAVVPSTVTSPGPVPSTPTAGQFNATDIAWLQLTAAMTERLLPVLDMVPGRTTDPAWRRLAARVGAAHRDDLDLARRLLTEAGAPATNPHEGHDMPGMATEAELTALRSADGVAFHRLAERQLRAHLAQTIRIAAAEQRGGNHPATTAFAAAVLRTGNGELARLDRMDLDDACCRT
ncbi:DUF305 domain-containing protein [Micromonospora endolithica]|uniref:DUF305 domain-containing protein n=1 Tax=Micromonospora endolithica TaxID=230091 RepID=A0A3A9ZGD4_9ACTN|nr:DUF305 domain-containing protein [Micromonospora endolithica]RKN47602.1 DUF305 domain-containing protein [Micromonospora endolithica]TWJ21256.1 protein of unknown function (DUF305) [Micromonospora endolithica]